MRSPCVEENLPGKGGTTILLSRSSSLLNHSKSLYLLLTVESLSLNTGKFVFDVGSEKCQLIFDKLEEEDKSWEWIKRY